MDAARSRRILMGLLAISAAIHALVLTRTVFSPVSVTAPLELGLQILDVARPPEPAPPHEPFAGPPTEPKPVPRPSPKPAVRPKPAPAPQPPPPEPAMNEPAAAASPLVEAVAASALPASVPRFQQAASLPFEQADHGSGKIYYQMVRQRIESRKKYPPMAMRRQLQGRVTVRFAIMADGGLGEVTVTETCPFQVFNDAAVFAVKSGAPYPRPPSSLSSDALTLEITIVFELT